MLKLRNLIASIGLVVLGVLSSSAQPANQEFYRPKMRTDSMTVSGKQTVGDLDVTGIVRGSSLLRGTASFTTTAVRDAVYIPGATASSYYVVSSITADATTQPVAGDLLNCFAKTDSLIVLRVAGTTKPLGYNYIRIE